MGLLATAAALFSAKSKAARGLTPEAIAAGMATWRQSVVASLFWAGEGASDENGYIQNASSAWQENWAGYFGGIDDPKKRAMGAGGASWPLFAPKENPFYVAIPLNDLKGGTPKVWAGMLPWASEAYNRYRRPPWIWDQVSTVKNQWLQITALHSGEERVAYAQIQDAGPFGEDDTDYALLAAAPPKNRKGLKAGIDLSPALMHWLTGSAQTGKVTVSWRWVLGGEAAVPPGPWKSIVTESQCAW